MAYTKYTWTDGEVITAQKLNHMEDGIEDAGSGGGGGSELFLVTFTYDSGLDEIVADKTYNEIITASKSGKIIMGCYPMEEDGEYSCVYYSDVSINDSDIYFCLVSPTTDPTFAGYLGSIILDSNNDITLTEVRLALST